MSKMEVLAGDFVQGKGRYANGRFILFTKEGAILGENISVTKLLELEEASEENVRRLSSSISWGVVGAITLGGVGFLAGLLLGGKDTNVTFAAKFNDGRKLLAITSRKTFLAIQAAKLEQGATFEHTPVFYVPESVKKANTSFFNDNSNYFIPPDKSSLLTKLIKFLGFVLKVSVFSIVIFLLFAYVLSMSFN